MGTRPVHTKRVPPPVQSAAQSAARTAAHTAGRLTSGARMLPSFLIVGAQRCGTTSMFKALVQHPNVLRPPLRKGIHYFDTDYRRGLSWYRAHFPLRSSAKRVQQATGAPAVTGESSPYYMFHPLCGRRIAADLPGVKLLVLLRDPVERAYSAHAHERARGFETEPFERALELEDERLAGQEDRLRADPAGYSHAHQHNAYLARGHYIDQLEALERLFGRDRLHVVDSQDFFAEPEQEFEQVRTFLELPGDATIEFERHNARPRPPMPAALLDRLDAHFLPYDERLADWLGQVPSWRR